MPKTTGPPAIPVWCVVPAAGLSRRMGKPKQILPFGTSTVTGTVVGTLLSADPAGVVVVTRRVLMEGLALPEDPRVRCVINDDDGSEMIDSIRVALDSLAVGEAEAAATDGANSNATRATDHTRSGPRRVRTAGGGDGICVVPGDLPHLSSATVTACFEAYRRLRNRIVVAAHKGERGHPIVFPFGFRVEVDALTGGLNELVRSHLADVTWVETTDAGTLKDVDTPGDLAGISNAE